MTPAIRVPLYLVLLSAIIVTGYHNSVKLRRDGVLNLYPFPRVGRASQRTWQIPLKGLYYDPIEKRQLYAFPRVGRGDGSSSNQMDPQPMQLRRSDSPGMWFGPRLGRGFKNDEDELNIRNLNNERSEPEILEPEVNEVGMKRTTDEE